MDKNPYLKTAEKMLKKQKFHTSFKDTGMLEVSMNDETNPFAYLVIEQDQFPGIILSLSIDFQEPYIVADMVINLMHIAPIALGEPFYRGNDGMLFWDQDAVDHFNLENNKEFLKTIEPVNKSVH